MYPCVLACVSLCAACACIQRLVGVSLLIQAWRLSDPASNPPAHQISRRCAFVPCRQHRETIASHLCNLQTSSICSVSARASAEMHGPLTCSAVSPGLPCGRQMCATDSFLYLSTQLCLIGPSTQTTVQSGSPVASSFCSACLNRPHACVFCLVGMKCFPTRLKGD